MNGSDKVVDRHVIHNIELVWKGHRRSFKFTFSIKNVRYCLPRIDLIKTMKWNNSHSRQCTKKSTFILHLIWKISNTNSFEAIALRSFSIRTSLNREIYNIVLNDWNRNSIENTRRLQSMNYRINYRFWGIIYWQYEKRAHQFPVPRCKTTMKWAFLGICKKIEVPHHSV